jgi:hypothetical protein
MKKEDVIEKLETGQSHKQKKEKKTKKPLQNDFLSNLKAQI